MTLFLSILLHDRDSLRILVGPENDHSEVFFDQNP